ncbi:MAG TPA: enoyl-CoA hydratase/isomerase family protein [Acidimicrobiales bacterium]|jgi:enoyl-CoA hydratase/carnithine racemase|nr:enoyl-CoA hydratase/isomerase family protein [Acidimicrobiales bacterium]
MRLEFDAGVGVLTLDRPGKRNALSADFVQEITEAVAEVEGKGCVAGVLQAEGPVFCAGADRDDVGRHAAERSSPGAPQERKPGIEVVLRFKSSPTFWVAAIQGPAVGAGVSLAAVCSAAYATRDSWLSVPEIDFGIFPAFLLGLLVPLIGRRRAFELATSGRRFGAEEALGMGLLTGLEATAGDVQAVALQAAHRIAQKPVFAADAATWWGQLGETA